MSDGTARKVGMIWAQGRGGEIGLDGDMPWHLPEDLAHFRATTTGHPVIMGRVTWESLPERFRPLPGRENIVLTRDSGYAAPGATVCADLTSAIALLGDRDAWIMGGARVYASAIDGVDELVVTTINESFEADAFAPEIGPQWQEVARVPVSGWTTAASGLEFAITTYRRVDDVPGATGSMTRALDT